MTTDPTPETLIELSRVWFLIGDTPRPDRSRTGHRLRARHETGRAGAVALALRNDQAHLWLAINAGRTAEIRGAMRALALVSTDP